MSVWRLAPFAGLVAGLVAGPVAAQEWSFTARKIDARTYEVHMTVTMREDWHIYSQTDYKDHSATQFIFEKSPWIVPVGRTAEVGKLIIAPDMLHSEKRRYYENSVDFVQKVIVKGKAPATLKGDIKFTASSNSGWSPGLQHFSIDLK